MNTRFRHKSHRSEINACGATHVADHRQYFFCCIGDMAVGQTPTPPGQLEVFYGGAESRGQRDYQQVQRHLLGHL